MPADLRWPLPDFRDARAVAIAIASIKYYRISRRVLHRYLVVPPAAPAPACSCLLLLRVLDRNLIRLRLDHPWPHPGTWPLSEILPLLHTPAFFQVRVSGICICSTVVAFTNDNCILELEESAGTGAEKKGREQRKTSES